ncbi:MAG: RagB/SusD family nutrient uptake outer membrane protein [Bacteroidales bacterium]
MITNNIKKSAILLLTALLFTFSSCSDFLEETPYDFVGLEDLDDSKESVDYLVTGVYSKWCDNMLRYNAFPYSIELDADYISGPSWLVGSLGAGNFQDATNVADLWDGCYNLIERCNSAIEQIEPMENVEDDAKANALGELYFNKAICYFILTRAFGPIPLSDVSAKSAQEEGLSLYNKRSEIVDVYADIISLLEKAEAGLYAINDANYVVGHVASGSAAALLAKVYATMGAGSNGDGTITIQSGPAYSGTTSNLLAAHDVIINTTLVDGYDFDSAECYDKVIYYCEKLMNGEYGNYALLPFDSMWKHDSFNLTDGAEYMFTLYSVASSEVYGNKLNRYYSYSTTSDGLVSKGLWVGNRNHWYELFEDEDRRITEGVLHRWQSDGKDFGTYFPQSYSTIVESGVAPFDDGLSYSKASGSSNLAFVTKYFDVTDKTAEYADAYYSLLRYADVVLLYAEALNEKTAGSSVAKDLVYSVRERSLEGASRIDLDDAITRDALRSLIIEERAKELACESDRRWDLIRWGIYLDAMNALEGPDEAGIAKSRQSKHLLYPIPIDEVLANENITENNPGWN